MASALERLTSYAAGGWKITETLSNGYSSESTRQELSNDYQHDRVWMILKNFGKKKEFGQIFLCPCVLEECRPSIVRVSCGMFC